MDRLKQRIQKAAPRDYSDGRAWQPLDVSDGRARLVITEDWEEGADGVKRPVFHTDSFNMGRSTNDRAVQLYLRAGPLMANRVAHHLKGGGDGE